VIKVCITIHKSWSVIMLGRRLYNIDTLQIKRRSQNKTKKTWWKGRKWWAQTLNKER